MRIFVLFVEPMLYGMDLIHEVYEKTEYEFRYVYCTGKLTGKDDIRLPDNAYVCQGEEKVHQEQVLAILKEFQPDFAVINGYVGTEQTTAIRYCQKNQIPYAIESDTPLHIPPNKLKALAKKLYLKRLLGNPYCCGFPGGTLQKENLVYYGIPEEKNFIMPMSVSAKRMLAVSEQLPDKKVLQETLGLAGKRVFLFVGRLTEVKNVGLLVKTFAGVRKNHPDTALLIVGDGPERERLEKLVGAEQLQDVLFAGYVVFPEIIQYYKAADALVLPSTYEPWGLVVNEAMTMGLPVIVSDDVGCRTDLIRDGENGHIFESDREEDLERRMEEVLKRDADRYAAAARESMQHWGFEQYLNNFRRVIKKCCESQS